MRTLALMLLAVSFITGCASAEPKEPVLETEDQKTVYAVGVRLADMLRGREFSEAETELLSLGLADGLLGKESLVDMEVFNPKVNTLMAVRLTAVSKKEKDAGNAFCDEKATQEGARRTASGAVYLETQAGDGASPQPGENVRVHYHGTLRDGRVFDSSVDRDQPATFNVDRVVPCFSEGLREMKVGGKATLYCPADSAYGDRGQPPAIRPGSALTFEVELLEILGPATP